MERADCILKMYKAKLSEEDKWNIHSSSYHSSKYANDLINDKKDDKKYHEQKYGSKEKNASSDYIKKEESKNQGIFEDLEEEKKEQEMKEDDIAFKAARQVFNESKYETKQPQEKKDVKTIEDAIKKAIEDEKKVIIMDN